MADATVLTNENPSGTQPAGISYLSVPSWAGNYRLDDNGTDARLIGDLSDLPALTYYLSLYNCANVTGDLSDLPALTHLLSLYNCANVTGDLSDLPALTYYLSLYNCANVTGDLSDLPALTYLLNLGSCANVTGDLSDLPALTYYLSLSNCANVTGVMPADCKPTYVDIRNTACTLANIEGNIIKLDGDGKSNGTLLTDSVTLTNATAITSFSSLTNKNWSITGATIP
jgi:hypothetical protein